MKLAYKFMCLIMIVITITIIAGCQGAQRVKVGLLVDLSDKSSSIGIEARDAALMAVEAFNDQNKELYIELVVKDSQGDASMAKLRVEAFVNEGVKFVIGPYTSGETDEIKDTMLTGDLLFISPTVSTDSMLGRDDFFVRIIGAASLQGELLAETAMNNEHNEHLVIVSETSNSAFTEPIKDTIMRSLSEDYGRDTQVFIYNQQEIDEFSEIIESIMSVETDGIVFLGNSVDSATMVQQLANHGYIGDIYLSMWSNSSELISNSGKTIEGAYLTQIIDMNSKSPELLAYDEAFISNYHIEPNFGAYYTDESMSILFDALMSSKDISTTSIKSHVTNLGEIKGYNGDYTINNEGDSDRNYVLMQVVDSKLQKVMHNE